jgi:tRNA-splicing ligase RtcB
MITGRDLIERGWPQGRVIGLALAAAEKLRASGMDDGQILGELEKARNEPAADVGAALEPLAREWAHIRAGAVPEGGLREETLPYEVWGADLVEPVATAQMEGAMRLPVSVGGALMPDAHLGYGLPVGGVLATEGTVIPWAVGVDIAPLRGDTLIPTLDGRSYAIKELCERGERFGVWSCKPEGKVVAAWARAFRTQRDAALVRVTLDDGRVVECTPDHRFMLRDGTYLEAGRLTPGDSLMPFYSRLDREGYVRVQQNYSGAFLRAHWIVARSGLLGAIPSFEGQRTVIHHENFDEADNRPENLRFMGDRDHSRYHRALVEKNDHWQSEEFERKRVAALSAKKLTAEGMEEYRRRAENLRAYWAERPEEFDGLLERISENNKTPGRRAQSAKIGSRTYACGVCGKEIKSVVALASHHRWKHPDREWKETYVNTYNHRVAKVEKLPEREDVYCLDVPEYHNFALDAGVFVHNCRMRLSVFDVSPGVLEEHRDALTEVLLRNTNFGAGSKFKEGRRPEHEVLDDSAWEATPFLKGLKDTARAQLGTSGSGNHFVEWGVLEALDEAGDAPGEAEEGVSQEGAGRVFEPGRRYLALLSHSGSRGVGFKIANRYSKIARDKHPKLDKSVADLSWLELSSEEGEEYWISMQLAGRFASANHAVIHDKVAGALGEEVAATVENHHNFCIAGDQTVPTTAGPKRMDEIEVGDTVYAADPALGLVETRVTDAWCSGSQKTYSIRTDSREIRCTGTHRIMTVSLGPALEGARREAIGRVGWKRADELSEGDVVVCADGYFANGHSMGKDAARLLGAFLGDGWVRSTKPQVSGYGFGLAVGAEHEQHAAEYLALCERTLPVARWSNNAPGAYGLTCSSKAVYGALESLGFSGKGRDRTLPAYAYSLPRAEKMELLAGYMDADASNRGRGAMVSTNGSLVNGLRELALSCGLRVTPVRREGRTTNFGPCLVYRCVMAAGSVARLNLWHRRKSSRLNPVARDVRGLANGELGGVVLPDELFAQKVRKIEVSEAPEPVYDLSVEHGSHSFVCSGVVVHNCWREEWNGKEVLVHRKGATPAGRGVMGVIPGSMADPGYVVRGRGNERSLNSASHGAGRLMSRSAAIKSIPEERWRSYLAERGVTLIGGSLDEAPMAYKDVEAVIGLQGDLVDLVGRFTPKIVRMDAASRSRGKKRKG